MKINLSGAGKRFSREWIFRNADLGFISQESYAITGPNGSGKSTLLQSIGGILQLSEGTISYVFNNKPLAAEKVFSQVSFCAPYLELIEELTLTEFLHFHKQFKPFIDNLTPETIIKELGLEKAASRQIRNYSSGMKQRVKLAQAIYSDTAILLLDEPCSNLDTEGIQLYRSLIEKYGANRLIIVSSNDEVEYRFCTVRIPVQQFKTGQLSRRGTL